MDVQDSVPVKRLSVMMVSGVKGRKHHVLQNAIITKSGIVMHEVIVPNMERRYSVKTVEKVQ